MVFPKKFMKISELIPLGFSRTELSQYAHRPNQNFAYRPNGEKGQFKFDTDKFQDYLDKEIERNKKLWKIWL